VLFNRQSYGANVIDDQLSALAATGATIARADALWEASEPEPPQNGVHHYDWAFNDQIAAALAARHLSWLPIIDYTAPWAQSVPGQDHSPPASDADYAAYAAAFAGRYGPGGTFWRSHPSLQSLPVETYEIWNEPDSTVFWYPRPNAARYYQLYAAARNAIVAVQPHATVIVGGLSNAATFIPKLASAAPDVKLDGVGIHPYGPNPQAVLGSVRGARAALSAAGLANVPLYVTEFGWATSPPGGPHYLPESLRPAYIQQALTALGHLDCGIAAVLLYAWVTPQSDPSDSNDWFGIHPPGGGDTPDMRAFTQGLHDAAAPGPTVHCS
jgi:polysaccharide biosynthesis protein PslG